jgi:hypothetical protein
VRTVKGFVGGTNDKVDYVLVGLDETTENLPSFTLHTPDGDVTYANTFPIPRYISYHSKTQKCVDNTEVYQSLGCHYFPLTLAYALTIHKAQGVTTDNAIIEINDCKLPQQPYVAMSRIRSMNGLRFKSLPRLHSLNKMANSDDLRLLSIELERLPQLMTSVLSSLNLLQEDHNIVQRMEQEDNEIIREYQREFSIFL